MFTANATIPAGSFVTFVSGLSVTSVKGTVSGKTISAAIPSGDAGQIYVFVTSKDAEGTLADRSVLFGPAILEGRPPAQSSLEAIAYGPSSTDEARSEASASHV